MMTITLFLVVLLVLPMTVVSDSPTFAMGIMSMAKDRDRRDAMRETWTKNLKDRDDLKAFFVLGRLEKDHKEKIEKEMEEFGDIVVLECVENQHKGKTILWFEHVYRNTEFDFAVKVDQDVYVWTDELSKHIKALRREFLWRSRTVVHESKILETGQICLLQWDSRFFPEIS